MPATAKHQPLALPFAPEFSRVDHLMLSPAVARGVSAKPLSALLPQRSYCEFFV